MAFTKKVCFLERLPGMGTFLDLPPPSGVPGWGAFTTAKPGVKIWPLDVVKDWATHCEGKSGRRIDIRLRVSAMGGDQRAWAGFERQGG
jgi:hypothetical protein